jgi:hypothetical protein
MRARANTGCKIQKSNLSVYMNHCWQQKRKRLSAARGGDADHVSAKQGHGPTLALDGSGRLKVHFQDFPKNIF